MESLRSQKMLVPPHPWLGQGCPAQLRHPGRTLGFPWASAGKGPWGKAAKQQSIYIWYIQFLLEKRQHSPKAIWGMISSASTGEAESPAGQRGTFHLGDPELWSSRGMLWQDLTASSARQEPCALCRNVTEECLTYLIWYRIIWSLMSVLITLTEGKGSNLTANI